MDNSQADSSRIVSKNLFQPLADLNTPVFDRFDNKSAGVSFSDGIGLVLDPTNQFVFPILRAESTTLSYMPSKKEISEASGE